MRILTAAAILAFALTCQAAQAQGRPATGPVPGKAAEKVYSAEESAAMSAAIRKKDEAAALARDERLRKATRGICTGC
jgi:outer membrane protease